MKKRGLLVFTLCLLTLLCVLALRLTLGPGPGPEPEPVSAENGENFGRLLNDLAAAVTAPGSGSETAIEADLAVIRAVSGRDARVAQDIAEHWRRVYLDPNYRLYLYRGEERAEELIGTGIPDSAAHAVVVLGFELRDGEMQPELMGRCEAAAAVARAFPNTVLVCSGGATGENNPQKHTEAGLMKDYLVNICGIGAERIFIDERAMSTQENAVNSLRIMKELGVRSMTIVTSDYHQRWGQAVYNAAAALCREREGYSVEILGNYCYEIEPAVEMYRHSERIAVMQISGILGLPRGAAPAKGRP